MTENRNQNIDLTCLFGTFVFLQFTVLGLANHAGEGLLSPSERELVYYALQVFVIFGFLLHSVFVRLRVYSRQTDLGTRTFRCKNQGFENKSEEREKHNHKDYFGFRFKNDSAADER